MIGNLLEHQIINVFNRDITQLYSINAISKQLKKSYPHINQKVNSLINAGIIKKITIGKSHICRIDLDNDLGIAYLTMDEIRNKAKKEKNLPKELKEISKLLNDTKRTINIIFSNKKLYVVTDEKNKRSFSQYSHKIILATEEEFKQIILENPTILKEHLILQSYENYFKLLREIQGQIISLNLK